MTTAGIAYPRARILIVDDEESNVVLLEEILCEAGYTEFRGVTDSRDVERICREFKPDILLLDLMMPYLDGYAILNILPSIAPAPPKLPVIILSGDITAPSKQAALAGGASDFIVKPFDDVEVLLRMQNLLSLHFAEQELLRKNVELTKRVKARTRELEDLLRVLAISQNEVMERLAHAMEYRDDATGLHTQRVARVAELLAKSLNLSSDAVEMIRRAAPLHDIGKIGVSDLILMKPGKLTEEEFDAMKRHTTIGAHLLSGGQSVLMHMAERIARSHHERWDGKGYPDGLAAEDIPIEGRIVAVADVFDALTHERPYKDPWPVPEAVQEIDGQSGKQFDPEVVRCFLTLPHDELV